MQTRVYFRGCAVIAVVLAFCSPAIAQTGVPFSGRLLNSLSGEPVVSATVQLDELRRETVTGQDGTFTFENLTPGTYHLSVRSQGFSSRRVEVVVGTAAVAPIDIVVDPELHFQEVTSVSAETRSQFETFQPTVVLSGQELTKALATSLGATLDSQPGVASRSFGPATGRPVVRGLDGDRVQILEDGQRLGDLSSQSGDHGVPVNPAAARSIEVIRGPATLMYGTNAVGGLVNVITDEIPTHPVTGRSGTLSFDVGTAAREGTGAGHVQFGNGRFAMTLGGGGQRNGDVATPEGRVENSQSRSGFANLGASWTGANSYAGGSYGYDDTKYGIPVVEDGILQLTPRRHSISLRAGSQNRSGFIDAFRTTLAIRRYRHDELEGEEVGTRFRNDTTDLEVMGSHRATGRLKGSAGGWFLNRSFEASGEEALSPPVDQRGVAAFLYEEVTWPHVTLQFAGRVDHTQYEPLGEPNRSFTNGSVSAGLLIRPAVADDRLTIAASLARAARAPALEELFFFGLHHGNFAIELGNPELESEHALGFDVSMRWRSPRASGEVTFFRNDIANFIFREQLEHEEFEARETQFLARFPGRALAGHSHDGDADEEVAIVNFIGADAVLSGVEMHGDIALTSRVFADLGLDYVRGEVKEGHEPLPRIPPLRFRGGLRYQYNAFQAGGEVIAAAAQDRVSGAEQPTEGYQLLKLFTSYSFDAGGVTNTVTARLENATNELYRSHLSLIKESVPEMGRNFKVSYHVRF